MSFEEIQELIIDSIEDIRGENIVKMDLRHLEERPTDMFIICEGESSTKVKGIADNIYRRVKDEAGTLPINFEGQSNSTWILLDYFDIVVHIFYPETRAFYELEQLWQDAIITEYENK